MLTFELVFWLLACLKVLERVRASPLDATIDFLPSVILILYWLDAASISWFISWLLSLSLLSCCRLILGMLRVLIEDSVPRGETLIYCLLCAVMTGWEESSAPSWIWKNIYGSSYKSISLWPAPPLPACNLFAFRTAYTSDYFGLDCGFESKETGSKRS